MTVQFISAPLGFIYSRSQTENQSRLTGRNSFHCRALGIKIRFSFHTFAMKMFIKQKKSLYEPKNPFCRSRIYKYKHAGICCSSSLNRVLILTAPITASTTSICARLTTCYPFQESSNGPVKKSMREKAIERRTINKEHNSNFKAGYVPIEEERLHKTGLRGRKGNIAVCFVVLLFLLALINLIVSRYDARLMFPLGTPS